MPPSPCPGATTEVWVVVASGLVALGFNEDQRDKSTLPTPTPEGQVQQAQGRCG